jgi:glycosyltransferase involved in cell wall biosynthesis
MSEARVLVLFGNIPMWGQERANIYVYESLKATGVESMFVTNRDWGYLHVQPALDARGLAWTTATFAGRYERAMGLKRWAVNLIDMARASRELLHIVRRFRPTGLHVANPAFFMNFFPALLWLRLPMVYRLGDAPASHTRLHRFLWRRIIAPRVSRFVCDSRFIQDRLLELGIEKRRTIVIYPPPPSRTHARKNPRLQETDATVLTVIYVGQLSPHKGVNLLVEAAMRILARRRDFRFLVAGDYEDNAFAQNLMAEVRAAGLDGAIRFLGWVEDVPGLLALGNVHVCPTLSEEPLGLVVMEAKQAGLPSIVFRSGGLAEIVAHGADGYICSGKTADALVTALLTYAGNPALCALQGTKALASLERLGVGQFVSQWLQVWRESLNER